MVLQASMNAFKKW